MASNSKNKILQIWERQFSRALFMLHSSCSGGMVPFRMSSEQTTCALDLVVTSALSKLARIKKNRNAVVCMRILRIYLNDLPH